MYEKYTDDELLLAHTICHTLFSLRKPEYELIRKSHSHIANEMEFRNLDHRRVDKLDD